jgi:tRNA(Arg) A34 adenosine deaminase TadA
MTTSAFPINLEFVRRSIQLSAAAVAHGDEPFGALLAKDGQILLEAENTIYTQHDVTNHAETNLVRLAVQRFDEAFLAGCVLYTSTEPCPMCAGAIYWSGIGAVVYACSAERLAQYSGVSMHIDCEIILGSGTHDILVQGPVLEDDAAQVHAAYWKPKS